MLIRSQLRKFAVFAEVVQPVEPAFQEAVEMWLLFNQTAVEGFLLVANINAQGF
jgi:hypothetical protein